MSKLVYQQSFDSYMSLYRALTMMVHFSMLDDDDA